ncbi:hypothetical protein CCACVL1_02375 [Corchorus capsularis]|uniref:WIF domain-containing protein n=1 Tax=Corchorus capsularis TaxID=210143 RepID=A0A1R3K900_COCAP|nr:hypothetical protein CCACVL1_02375 [Corchorus capsularis]
MKKRSKNKDWAWLPEIPLELILVKLVSLKDFACFGAACKRWNSIANDTRKKLCVLNESRPQPPFLLIPEYGSRYDRLRLYSVTERKILHSQFQNPYPNSYPDLGWVGSSRGWLLVADQSLKITLFNPFSYKAIILPPIPGAAESFSKLRVHFKWFITKAILSADPVLHPHDFEVSLIYGYYFGRRSCRLGVYKSSEKAWTSRLVEDTKFYDIIYHKGKIHLVDDNIGIAQLLVATDHLSRLFTTLVPVIRAPAITTHSRRSRRYLYLVENGDGDLLVIERSFQEKYPNLTRKFEFKKFDPNPEGVPQLVKIKDIGDNAVFLGRHESIVVPTCHFPGLRRNCIYFSTDDLPRERGGDAGIFNLDDGSIERYNNNLPLPLCDDVVWIMPTLTCHDNIKWQTKLSSMIHEELDS